MSESSEPKVPVSISRDLYEQIAGSIKGTGFSSVDDYVNYVLRIAVGKQKDVLSAEDTEAITSRLKALGYV